VARTNAQGLYNYFDNKTKKKVQLKAPPKAVINNPNKTYTDAMNRRKTGKNINLSFTGGRDLTFLSKSATNKKGKFTPSKQSPNQQRLSGGKRVQKATTDLINAKLYLAQGGSANTSGSSADRIPAMLTPGEFVMSPEAVRTHGVGLMKKLNRGQATGFRTGGLVGSRAVAYRHNGSSGAESGGSSSLSIDSSSLQSVLSEFSASFSSSLDNMVVEFSNMSASMTSLASAITGGMVVNHQFSGDMSLAFKLENADTLKTAISDAMTPKIVEVITTEINRRLDTKDFKSQ
jgi:hypothetical protein